MTGLAVDVAAELADEFLDGVWVVELTPVGGPAAVPTAIAAAPGVTPQGEMAGNEVGGRSRGRSRDGQGLPAGAEGSSR